MDFLIDISQLAFILGTAAVFGGFFHQRSEKSKDITSGMFIGSLVGLIGYVLLLIFVKIDLDVSMSKNNWLVLIILAALAAIAFWKRDARKSDPLTWWAAGILSAAAFAFMFIWHI